GTVEPYPEGILIAAASDRAPPEGIDPGLLNREAKLRGTGSTGRRGVAPNLADGEELTSARIEPGLENKRWLEPRRFGFDPDIGGLRRHPFGPEAAGMVNEVVRHEDGVESNAGLASAQRQHVAAR